MKKKVGIHQMPAVELPDGRWMTDTTKMIQWFESKIPENKIAGISWYSCWPMVGKKSTGSS